MNARDRIVRILTSAMGSETGALNLFRDAEAEGRSPDLGDVIEQHMSEYTDPNRWDMDAAAEEIHRTFLLWLPDMVAHGNARKIREWADNRPRNDYCRKAAARRMADMIDPFRRCENFGGCDRSPHWVRKRDGEEVPWNVLGADEEE